MRHSLSILVAIVGAILMSSCSDDNKPESRVIYKAGLSLSDASGRALTITLSDLSASKETIDHAYSRSAGQILAQESASIIAVPSTGGSYTLSGLILSFSVPSLEETPVKLDETSDRMRITGIEETSGKTLWRPNLDDSVLKTMGISSLTAINNLQYNIEIEPNKSGEIHLYKIEVNPPRGFVLIRTRDTAGIDCSYLLVAPKDSPIDEYYAGKITKQEAIAWINTLDFSEFIHYNT